MNLILIIIIVKLNSLVKKQYIMYMYMHRDPEMHDCNNVMPFDRAQSLLYINTSLRYVVIKQKESH